MGNEQNPLRILSLARDQNVLDFFSTLTVNLFIFFNIHKSSTALPLTNFDRYK